MTSRFQMTVAFGSGEKGKQWEALIEKLMKRYNVDGTEVVRIAVRTLAKVSKEQAVLDEKV